MSLNKHKALGQFCKRVILIVFSIWFAGLILFLVQMSARAAPDSVKVDAIVVLTGGIDRIPEALRLLDAGFAKKLFISGVAKNFSMETLRHNFDFKSPISSIALGSQARDTIGNADETEIWIRNNNFTRVRLVTDFYHLPRSLLIFRRKMPKIFFVGHPVRARDISQKPLENRTQTLLRILREYHKYIFVFLIAGYLKSSKL